jgi:hypothetical protein
MASAYLFGGLALTPSESRKVALIANPEFEAGRVAGHRARRLIDGANPAFSDPFLIMAEDWVPRDTFSRHPHRGIETVALVPNGAFGHTETAAEFARARPFNRRAAKVWHRANEIGYPYGTIVQLLILTGQRCGETAALRWDWIKADGITIPANVAKNGHATVVPVGPMAREVIKRVPKLGPLLFPACGYDDKPFGAFGVKKIALDKCGVENFTHHDLRRTASTMWAHSASPSTSMAAS